MGTPSESVQSVSRVFDIIEALGAAPLGLALSDLASITGLHVSTTHRLLGTLVNRGYVMKDSFSGRYRLTMRMFEVGGFVSGTSQLLSAVTPLLDELAFFTREAVHLVKQSGTDVIYIYKAEPLLQTVRMGSYVGCKNPMYCTGVGKCMLALMDKQEVIDIWNRSDICAYTPNTITEFPVLLKELEQIRQQGYALDNEEHEIGVRCIAVPVLGYGGRPAAAISISAPIFRMDDAVIQLFYPRMEALAKKISHYFGRSEYNTGKY